MSFNVVAIFLIKENDYIIHFWYMSKSDTISIMNNSSLNEKTGSKNKYGNKYGKLSEEEKSIKREYGRKSFMHNGLMTSSSLYPIKYLSEFFVLYDSFFRK